MDLFINTIRPILDVFFIALIIYFGYSILSRTRAVQLLRGTIAVVLLYGLAFFLQLDTLLWIMNFLTPSIVVALAIIFQPELRQIFTRLGQQRFLSLGTKRTQLDPKPIIEASFQLARSNRGALLVIMRNVGLSNIITTGTILNAELSIELLLTIFETDTPLHDGAVIISDNKIIAAGCLLPLSAQKHGTRHYGTRHKAAIGLAEESDAVVIVVSEEKHWVSIAYNATMYEKVSKKELWNHIQKQIFKNQSVPISKEVKMHHVTH